MKFDNKFDEDLKNEMDLLSPSEEQIERIKKGVYERIEREANAAEPVKKPKKPLRIKIAAISGAACAAALVISVIGIQRHFDIPLSSSTNFINSLFKGERNAQYNTDAANGITAGGPLDAPGSVGSASPDGVTGNAAEFSDASVNTESVYQPSSYYPEDGGSYDAILNTAASSSGVLYLSFSEDKESCTVTVNGKTTAYEKAKIYGSAEADNADLNIGGACLTENDIEEKLFVHFDENDLYVFYGSGELFGHYKAK